MRSGAWTRTAGMVAFAAALGFAGDETTVSGEADFRDTLRVIDIEIVSTNRVRLGANTMSVEAATNLIARQGDSVDLIAIHEPIEEQADFGGKPSLASLAFARAGVPLVLVEKNGAYAWREHAGSDGVRTVKIGTTQVAALRRLWARGNDANPTSPRAALQTTVDWDPSAGSYALRRVELGFLGDRVWLIHEPRETEHESGTIGIRFKRDW